MISGSDPRGSATCSLFVLEVRTKIHSVDCPGPKYEPCQNQCCFSVGVPGKRADFAFDSAAFRARKELYSPPAFNGSYRLNDRVFAWCLTLKIHMRNLIYLSVFIVFGNLNAQTDPAQEAHALSLVAYHGHGDFGFDVDTDITYLPLRYEYDVGNWGFQLLVPMLTVDGPGSVLINLGGVNRIFAGSERRQESGLGDIVGSLIYRTRRRSSSATFIDLRLDIKMATANEEKGLGSGETDVNLQVDLSQYVGQWLLFGSIGYSLRGESELYPDLRDGTFAQFGAAFPIQDTVSMGLLYDFREAVSSFTSDIHEVGPYVNWQLNDNWSLTGMTMAGLTRASVDYSALAQLRYSW